MRFLDSVAVSLYWNWPMVLIVSFAAFLVLLILARGTALERQREVFMAECIKDRKQYECIAMWRGAST